MDITTGSSRPAGPVDEWRSVEPCADRATGGGPARRRCSRLLDDYVEHLARHRDLSAHTVRAYRGDLPTCSSHLHRLGARDLSGLTFRSLRSWLANQQTPGRLARHAATANRSRAGVRSVGGCRRAGWSTTRPRRCGHRGGSGRCPRTLESADAAAMLTEALAVAADGGNAGRGCGMWRCSSCCTPPASGSRSCAGSTSATSTTAGRPSGCSARATSSGLCRTVARPLRALEQLARPRPGPRWPAEAGRGLSSGDRGRPDRPAGGPPDRAPRAPGGRRRPRPRSARAAARDGHPPAGGRCRPAQRPGDARPRLAGHHADLHPRLRRSGCGPRSSRRTRAPERSREERLSDRVRRPLRTSSSGWPAGRRPTSIRCRWQPVE